MWLWLHYDLCMLTTPHHVAVQSQPMIAPAMQPVNNFIAFKTIGWAFFHQSLNWARQWVPELSGSKVGLPVLTDGLLRGCCVEDQSSQSLWMLNFISISHRRDICLQPFTWSTSDKANNMLEKPESFADIYLFFVAYSWTGSHLIENWTMQSKFRKRIFLKFLVRVMLNERIRSS